jgi:hypothetical protein
VEGKTLKKSLSKYAVHAPPETHTAPLPAVAAAAQDEDDNDDYGGAIDHDEFGIVVKKTLSKHAPAAEVIVRPTMQEIAREDDSDEEYGQDVDTHYLSTKKLATNTLTRHVVLQDGEAIITDQAVTPAVCGRAGDSDEEYGDKDGVSTWD